MSLHPLLEALETSIRFAPETYTRFPGLLGDAAGNEAAPAMVWSTEAPSGDEYAFAQGHRYAVLASVSLNYSLAEIVAKMTSLGFTVTYSWEEGSPTRGLYDIDAWLASLPADTTSNHRWVYGEADRVGADTTLGVDAPWPLTVYHVAHVFEAVPAPPGSEPLPTLPPPGSVSSAPSSSSGPSVLVVAGGVGVLGLLAWLAWRFL